ncbi:MAG: UDP-2,3-diacylglucosamine diphosphatase [Planctomycetes bacterium]|nr:UDP-2,3-diacylglucosamine diphosphatase [Planctomycetota bacterium]
MTRILGTTIEAVPDDDRPALLVSDLHVPGDGGPALAALDLALCAAQARAGRLFVLGDLFDCYVSAAQVRRGVFRDVAARFAAAAARGVAVHLLRGNRDFLLGDEFAAASRARLARGGLRLRLGGRETVLLHGDELCRNDLPYQRAKRWLRHPCTRWLLRRLPAGLALRLGERARARSRKVVMSGDQQRFLPTRSALGEVFAAGAELVVFGHIHRHAAGSAAGGCYRVLPAFDADRVGLLADAGGLRPVRFLLDGGELRPVAEPPDPPFPP